MKTILFHLLLLMLTAACSGLGGEPRIVATIPPQPDIEAADSNAEIAAQMTLGGEVWMANCAECHGRMGFGTPTGAPLPDLTNYTDEQILASITNGVISSESGEQVMPAFGERLAPEQLEAARTYARMMSIAIARGMINPDGQDDAVSAAQPQETAEAAAVDEVMGVVSGQVLMGTAGAALPADLALTLHVVKSEISEQRLEAVAAPDGSYRIEAVPFAPDYQYVLTVPYGDLQFVSEIATADAAATELTLPITLYETGAPPEAIQINSVSAQALVQNGTLQLIQIVSFINTSDRVYFNRTVEDGTSVWMRLPQGATLLSNMSQQYILSTDGAQIYSIDPILPGRAAAMHAAFAMPYIPTATTVEQVLDFTLAGPVEISVASEGVGLTGEGFAETAQSVAGSTRATTYAAEFSQAAGASLRYELAGVPVVPPPPVSATAAEPSPLAYVLIGAGASALLIAGILFIRERLTSRPTADATGMGALMEKIATLDSQHKAGKLNARDYERQRRVLKDQLSALMKEQ